MPIVETTLADSCIDHKSCRLGSRLVGIIHNVPTQYGLSVACEFHTETIGCQRTDSVAGVVHTADIAEQRLIDATGKEEPEVGILSHPHIGEILV